MTKWNKYNTEGNVALVTLKLLELLHVPFTHRFYRDIKLHPEYPSLLSISNALHELNVKNIAVSISADQFSEISFPAIAQVQSNNGSFVILQKIENGVVHYLDDKLEDVQEAADDFVMDWTGILLLAETSEKSGEPNYVENRKLEALSKVRYAVMTILSVIIFSTLFFLNPMFIFPILMNALGMGLSATLLMQTFGQNSLLSEAVCKPNSKTDCDKVINSPMAKIYGDISLAEIGLLFFAGGLFTNGLLTLTGHTVFNPYLFSLLILGLPFSIFSIYYQWRIVKTWCSICLGVMGLLWVNSIYYWFNYSSLHFDTVDLILALIGYSLPSVIWLMIRPSIVQAQSISSLRRSLYKFSKNQNVFDALSQQRQLISGGFENELVLGNPEAKHAITLATSPLCGSCVNAHREIESWLDQFDENLKVIVRFVVTPKDNGSISNIVARNLISLALNGDDKKVKEAMGKWYNSERPELKEWLSSLPTELHPSTEEHIASHYEWSRKNKIMAVPSVFFDGKQIPAEYSLKDFENILRLKLNDSG